MSIFNKIQEASEAYLDNIIQKAKNQIAVQDTPLPEDDPVSAIYGKSVTTDPVYRINAAGYRERRDSLNTEALKRMAYQDSIVSAIIQTRQNHVARHSSLAKNKMEAGFIIELKNPEAALEAMKLTIKIERNIATDEDKEKLKELGINPDKIEVKEPEVADKKELKDTEEKKEIDDRGKAVNPEEVENGEIEEEERPEEEPPVKKSWELLRKANGDDGDEEPAGAQPAPVDQGQPGQPGEEGQFGGGMTPEQLQEMQEKKDEKNSAAAEEQMEENTDPADMQEEFDFALTREAKKRLDSEVAKRKKKVEDFILNCGEKKDRPFDSRKWNFDQFLRAFTRDTLTYDMAACEMVRDQADRPHHFFPVDGATIRFAAPSLKNYKDLPTASLNLDITYPEKQAQYLEEHTDTLILDEEKLEDDEYKYVQVIRGNIERAYTAKELKVGIRNVTTDIYNNGYGIAELEMLTKLVTSHLNTEYYNQSYFTQGFSAKGILHLKAPLNRRKLETVRTQWQHMLQGARNSFQTPIFAGVDDVNWIPLTQNHSDIEFQGWMNYLIKLICAIYQIDPTEIGYGMNEEGGSGGGLNGDNTDQKINLSRDKGLYPLMRWIENFINVNIIDPLDPDFRLVFGGLTGEDRAQMLERVEREVRAFKTVNEVRDEYALPPLPGMDDMVLDPTYFQWYSMFSEEGQKAQEQAQAAQGGGEEEGGFGEGSPNPDYGGSYDDQLDGYEEQGNGPQFNDEADTAEQDEAQKSLSKSIKIEWIKLEDNNRKKRNPRRR